MLPGNAKCGSLVYATYLVSIGLSDDEVVRIQGGHWTTEGVAAVRKAMREIVAERGDRKRAATKPVAPR